MNRVFSDLVEATPDPNPKDDAPTGGSGFATKGQKGRPSDKLEMSMRRNEVVCGRPSIDL